MDTARKGDSVAMKIEVGVLWSCCGRAGGPWLCLVARRHASRSVGSHCRRRCYNGAYNNKATEAACMCSQPAPPPPPPRPPPTPPPPHPTPPHHHHHTHPTTPHHHHPPTHPPTHPPCLVVGFEPNPNSGPPRYPPPPPLLQATKPEEASRSYERHFDHHDELVSRIT